LCFVINVINLCKLIVWLALVISGTSKYIVSEMILNK